MHIAKVQLKKLVFERGKATMEDVTDNECREIPNEELNEESSSSKEEVGIENELTMSQMTALRELKKLIQGALKKNRLTSVEGDHNATMWGVPLLGDKRSNFIILKFLKAANFEVLNAYAMIKNTLMWRERVAIESLLGEDLGNDYKNVMFNHGYDKEGYRVWYLILEENPSLIASSNEQNLRKFLQFLIQFAEKSIRKLDFSTNDRHSFLLVIDLKNSTWYGNRDLYKVIYRFLRLLHDYYPKFVAKQLWINVSWWYRSICRVHSKVFDVSSTNEVVAFSGRAKAIETLFKYISPAHVPVRYGGLSSENEQDSDESRVDDIVTKVIIKPDCIRRLEYRAAKSCNVLWKLRVISWNGVVYDAKFVPDMEGGGITNITRPQKLTTSDRPVISGGFDVNEPGKVVLTVHNKSSRKKQLLIRVQVMSSSHGLDHDPSLREWLDQSDE